MIVDAISDLHGHYPKLEGGDLLIVAGDLTARDTIDQFEEFFSWLSMQEYEKAIVIAGNHDNLLQKGYIPFLELDKPGDISIEYLCDSGTEFEGLKIWGSPWTKTFEGMNPKCMAFTCDTEQELAEKYSKIPLNTDILITHGPPYGILDWNAQGSPCGSLSLFDNSRKLKKLKLFCFGHIHEAYSMINTNQLLNGFPKPICPSLPIIVNCSHVNERYQPVNKPVRVIL